MKEKLLNKIQGIVMYYASQLSVIVFTLVLIFLLALYFINMFFKAESPMIYFDENSFEILILSGLILFCSYFSVMIIYLHKLKFGKTKLAGLIIQLMPLMPGALKLHFYNITGNKQKALEMASGFKNLEKQETARLYIIDAFINAEKYKAALKLATATVENYEYDAIIMRKALIYSKMEKHKAEAKELAYEAMERNKDLLVRNPDSKFLEMITRLSEVLLELEEYEEAYITLKPFINIIYKHTFYSTCRYSRYDLAHYFYILALIEQKGNNNPVAARRFLDMTVKMFKDSSYGKKAALLLSDIK